jgi:hypothetical protein
MSAQNIQLSDSGRHTRLLPGWWLLPSLMVGSAIWASLIWLFVA